jgi:hypothetical protein
MTSVEGWLLQRMTVRRWLVAVAGVALLTGGVCWKLGERHMANEVADQLRDSVGQVGRAIAQSLPEPRSPMCVMGHVRQQNLSRGCAEGARRRQQSPEGKPGHPLSAYGDEQPARIESCGWRSARVTCAAPSHIPS